MLFNTAVGIAHELAEIKEHGCSWARNYTSKRGWKEILVIFAVASVFGILGGASAVFAVMKIWP